MDKIQTKKREHKGRGKAVTVSRSGLKYSTINLTVIAMLTALLVVLVMYCTIKTEALKITLDFIPVMIAAKLYGMVGAAAVAGLGDIIGCVIHPTGPWFPPITFTAVLMGVVFGLMLKNNTLKTGREKLKAVLSVVIVQMILSAFVTPLWLHILYGTPYSVFFVTRLPQIGVMTAIELLFIPLMIKMIDSTGVLRLIRPRRDSKKNVPSSPSAGNPSPKE